MSAPLTFYEYCSDCWARQPFPVIDHHIRIERLPDGRFHFYIHPQNASGVTCDYVVDQDGVHPGNPREVMT